MAVMGPGPRGSSRRGTIRLRTMDWNRLNRAGIPRGDLVSYLKSPVRLRLARQRGSCLLCCARPVNEIALCAGCFACLTDEERRLAEPYLTAAGATEDQRAPGRGA